jgi:hypothetical protein
MTTALVVFVVVLIVVLLAGITLGMLVAGPLDRFTNAVRTPPRPDPDDAPRTARSGDDAPSPDAEPPDKETAP